MTHELKKIVAATQEAKQNGLKTVLVSVVDLDGSSYRKPGVRMLIREDDKMIGAVSGGCVEKEVLRQSQSVFKNGKPKLMVYDGRYRLGCEGILYMIIEPFDAEVSFFESFEKGIIERKPFEVITYFSKNEDDSVRSGSVFVFSDGTHFPVNKEFDQDLAKKDETLSVFKQTMKPCFRLLIIGAEHDAVQLCQYASLTGWEVNVITPPDDPKTIDDFPGADELFSISESEVEHMSIDSQTAVVLMTHGFVKDLKYLSALREKELVYIGLLGPKNRREKLLSQLLEYYPETPDTFFDMLFGPCGINIGAETPQEIAISIMAEILSVVRNQEPIPLKEKKSGIHD
ncbi:XshC-Cox1-family protein [Flavobacteriaceae bacterium R38]|nr:XshC-Cox1-family protein [Flavobacteriaceae bacterium R38]